MFCTIMIRLRIDKAATFLPISLSKGTLGQRLQKAKELNLQFYDNLQDEFVKREIKPSAFKRVLQETSGAKIGLDILEADTAKGSQSTMNARIMSNAKIKGFAFYLPINFFTGKIPKNAQFSFLPETQKFFNLILNPKFLTREVALNNKNPYQLKEAHEFYSKNMEGLNVLKKEDLHKFLQNKKNEEKINLLQYLRYSLFNEKTVKQAAHDIDKHIEKAEHLKFANKNYDLAPCSYDEKLAMLNETLTKTLKEARIKK